MNVYDTTKINEDVKAAQTLAQFETKGSFGTCVDIVRNLWKRRILSPY